MLAYLLLTVLIVGFLSMIAFGVSRVYGRTSVVTRTPRLTSVPPSRGSFCYGVGECARRRRQLARGIIREN